MKDYTEKEDFDWTMRCLKGYVVRYFQSGIINKRISLLITQHLDKLELEDIKD